MPLTDTAIKNLKPTGKDAFHADANGLYLRVGVSGSKTFMYRSRVGGKARWATIGPYPAVTLAEARRSAMNLASGQLPANVTVQAAYDEWYVRSITKTYKSPVQVSQRMELHVLSQLSKERVSSITRARLSTLLNNIAATAPVQANRVLTDVKLLFSYAVERGWIEDSPAERITQRTVGGKETTRARALTTEEIGRLIRMLLSNRFRPKTRWALAFLLLTGARSGEVRGMCSHEVNAAGWHLPSHRTKNGVAYSVTLPKTTQIYFSQLFNEHGSFPFDGMEGQTLARAMKRMKFEPAATPHDLRRTMSTHMAELGVAPHIVEKCLNHKMSGVMAIYNRAEYATEKKAAWRLWVRFLLKQRKAPSDGG